jgi:hypothetical protein
MGIEQIPLNVKDPANAQLIPLPVVTQSANPTEHVSPSAREVMPTALFPLIPERIWPPVTTGPYPPPLMPLLNAATEPKMKILFQENIYFLLRVIRITHPIVKTNKLMYILRAQDGSLMAIITAISDPTMLQVARESATLA